MESKFKLGLFIIVGTTALVAAYYGLAYFITHLQEL